MPKPTKEQIIEIAKLNQALKTGKDTVFLLEKINEIKSKIDNIPQTDLSIIESKLKNLDNKINEDLIIDLQIV